MEIGEFSKKVGITEDTLRYYNKIELLVPKRIKNRRWYTDEDLEKVYVITKLKNMRFTLDEIKTLFELENNIKENESLNDESRSKIESCLSIIEDKYHEIINQEKDLMQVKFTLNKMIDKTNKLLEKGRFFVKEC